MFLGSEPAQCQLSAAARPRSNEILVDWHPRLRSTIDDSAHRDLLELSRESESLVLATLTVGGRYAGYILLGPKEGGEVFVEEEKRLLATVAPMLALAIDKASCPRSSGH